MANVTRRDSRPGHASTCLRVPSLREVAGFGLPPSPSDVAQQDQLFVASGSDGDKYPLYPVSSKIGLLHTGLLESAFTWPV